MAAAAVPVPVEGTTPSPSHPPRHWLRPCSPVLLVPPRPMIRPKTGRRRRRRRGRISIHLPTPSSVDYGTRCGNFSGNEVGKGSPNASNGCNRSSSGGAIISLRHTHNSVVIHPHPRWCMTTLENRFRRNDRRCIIGERTG